MSKLSFRARALDPSKQMPIYLAEELPDLPEYSAINRAVPQMPSGMEKEEESEHHLQRAICTGLIIPTPEVYTTEQDFYDKNYPPNYRMPRQLIHMQPLGLEQDVPEYDMDSEDEVWVTQQRKRLDLTPFKFEQMMDRLEKSSGQTVVTLNEAKALLKQDDEVSIAVYDYWLNKRLKMQHPLILSVKTENRPGASSNNPYLAFRRRTEKMQTRKNRKNDETSYEKMLKLRRDLQRATTVLEMVKRREKTKREHVHLSIEIFEKRVQLKDFNGALLSELSATIKNSRPAFAPLYANQYSHHSSSSGATPTAVVPSVSSSAAGLNNVMGSTGMMTPGQTGSVTAGGHMYSSAPQYLNSANVAMDALNAGSRKEKRQYKKRKHKIPRDKQQLNHQQQQQQQQYLATMGVMPTSGTAGAALGVGGVAGIPGGTSSLPHHLPHHMHHHLHRQSSSPAPNESNIETEEEDLAHKIGSESEEEAPFAFRRRQGCDYLRSRAHTGNWPWEPKEEYGFGDTKYRYTLASIKHPRPRCIGFARRRMGRGGRILLDRVGSNLDDFWSQLDYTILESKTSDTNSIVGDTTTTTTIKTNKKDSSAKPASPPTVVDLVPPAASAFGAPTSAAASTTNVNNANTPATIIKQEIVDTNIYNKHLDNTKTSSVINGLEDDANGNDDDLEVGLNGYCEYEYSDDDDELEDEHGLHIQRDRLYHSCISMARFRRRRRRQQEQQEQRQQSEQNSKRRKLNNAHLQQKNMEAAQRRLLYKLSQSLMMDNGTGSVNGRVNNLVNSSTNNTTADPIKHEKVNGLNKTDDEMGSTTTTWTNHRCASTAATNTTVLEKLHTSPTNNTSISSSSLSSFSSSLPAINNNSNNNSSSLVIGIINNNNSSNNVNMNISNGSRSNNCSSISDKTNVIKREIIIQDADSENASTSSCNPGDLLMTSRAIKQEMMDSSAPSLASADDSNEPLSSIQKLGTASSAAADIVEDEENLNLAQLSNLIKIKKEEEEDVMFEYSNDRAAEMFGRNGGRVAGVSGQQQLASESEDDEVSCYNQMADVIRQRDLRRSRRPLRPNSSGEPLKGVNVLIEEVAAANNEQKQEQPDDELTMLGGLSPTSSQRLDICNELLSEIRRDWLHFRPKTPTETEKEDFWSLDMEYKLSSPLVDWSQQTPIAIEMVRESLSPIKDVKMASKLLKKESTLWKDDEECNSAAFITPAFKYEDLEADTQLLQSSFMSDITRGSSKSPEAANNSACLDLNFSGDSLNDINLLGDGDDADMLDNILQEVQIDDIKTLATNFWNGILDGENVDTEVDGDVEAAAGLLDGIDDATKKCDKSGVGESKKANTRGKGGKKACAALTPVGSSSFNCLPLEKALVKDETFFKQEEELKKEPCDEDEATAVQDKEVAVKSEAMDVTEAKVGLAVEGGQAVIPNNMIVSITPQQQQQIVAAPALVMASSAAETSGCANLNVQQEVVQPADPIVIAQPMVQQHHQSGQQQQQQPHPQPHLITHSTPLQVIGNTITLNPGDTIATTHNQLQATSTNPAATSQIQQHQQQPQPQQSASPQAQQQHQLTTIQVLQQPQGTTQQIRNVTVQQLHQLQLQQQQQRKLQLQQQQQQQKLLMQQRAGELVNAATNNAASGGASVIAQYIPNTTSNSNTTTTTIMRQPTLTPIGAATVTHNNSTGQMIYTTTSAGDVIGTATGSQKIYLQKAPVSLGSSTTTQGVNIINTSSGQQLTVQNIAGVQHINATGNGSNATAGPLIVTTSARNAVQQLTQQQMVGQPTQQIVWRQLGSTNVTTTPAGMLAGATTAVTNADGTVTATMESGNKIVWTNRPAQKRLLNGPESTDINKVLLNRKLSQRKIITQAHQQILQQQQQQQHLQQQQQQQQQQAQDDDLTTTLNALSGQETTTTTGVTYTTQQQQQQQQQQIQKVTTSGGGSGGGKVIKMPSSFPLLVSEVNLQQQQKHNTAAAIAANHNYSLQPTAAIITSQASQQGSGGGNKIYLTASSSGGAATNYTITNASELQSAAQKLQAAGNSNVKLQHLLSQQLLYQQGKLKRERILNIIGAATSVDGSGGGGGNASAGTITATSGSSGGVSVTGDNNKRVLYTSLVNVKQLQKNNTGQMQVQINPQGMAHAVLRNRIGNNQIFANMRTVPVATVVASAPGNNHSNNVTASNAGGGVGGGTTVQVVSSNQQTSTGNLNSNTSNSLNNSDQQQQLSDMNATGSGLTIINSTADLKSITVAASAAGGSAGGGGGGGGLIENTNNSSPVTANSNNSSSNGGGGSTGNSNVTTTNNTTTINR